MASGLTASLARLGEAGLPSTPGCGVPLMAAGFAVPEVSVVAVVPVGAVAADLPWAAAPALDPVVFALPVVVGVPVTVAWATTVVGAVESSCGAIAVAAVVACACVFEVAAPSPVFGAGEAAVAVGAAAVVTALLVEVAVAIAAAAIASGAPELPELCGELVRALLTVIGTATGLGGVRVASTGAVDALASVDDPLLPVELLSEL